MPWCVQSFPSWGRMWPRASDLDPKRRVTLRQPHVAHIPHTGPRSQAQQGELEGPLPCPLSPSTEGDKFLAAPPPPAPPTRPHLVMVPSMSEMTTLSSHLHK